MIRVNIRLDPAQPQERDALYRLLQYSLYEESATDQNDIGDDGLFAYPWFDAYFIEESRHAYFIRAEETGGLLGFAMVKSREYGRVGYKIAEFMVLPKYRRKGVGRQAAFACFDRFRGDWEVAPAMGSDIAYRFWQRTISAYTQGRCSFKSGAFLFSNG